MADDPFHAFGRSTRKDCADDAEPARSAPRKRVLVVDDQAPTAAGLRALLKLDGYEVHVSKEPREAVDALARQEFDAVVTDLEMPHVHGVEIVKAARAASARVAIFVVTAYTSSPAIQAALSSGALRIFGKPLDYEAFAIALQNALAGG